MKSIETGATFGHDIHNELDAIKELPISLLDTRQERLVNLLVNIVHEETQAGELTAPDVGVVRQNYWRTLECYAKDVGFKFLGSGHFSAAFSHDMLPNRVIKIGFKKEDSGAAYTAWCRANQHLAGVPVIHSVSREESCYTVVLDKLESYRDHMKGEDKDHLEDEYCAIYNAINGDSDSDTYSTDYARQLLETSKLIRKFFHGIASFDMHDENIMVHPKTGHLVITDPVSFSQDKATKCAALDFETLLAEIEETNRVKLIAKWKRRNELNRGKRAVERKALRKTKEKKDREFKARAARRDKGIKDMVIAKILNPTQFNVLRYNHCFASELWVDAAQLAGGELNKRLRDIAAPCNIVHAIDARMNNKFLMDHKGTPEAPNWGRLFKGVEAQVRRNAVIQVDHAAFRKGTWEPANLLEQADFAKLEQRAVAWMVKGRRADFIVRDEIAEVAGKGLDEHLWDQMRAIEQKRQEERMKGNKPQFEWKVAKGLELR